MHPRKRYHRGDTNTIPGLELITDESVWEVYSELIADAEKHAGRVLPVAERIAARLPGARARTGPGQVEIGHVALFCNSGRIWHDGTVYAELEEHKAELRRLYEEERDGVG